MQNEIGTMENNMAVLKKKKKGLKIELPYDPIISLLGIDPKELEAGISIDICMSVFTAALFTITKR